MYTHTKKTLTEVAKLCLMMDVMRDEIFVTELLSVPQTIPAQIALRKLKRLLRERRKLYL